MYIGRGERGESVNQKYIRTEETEVSQVEDIFSLSVFDQDTGTPVTSSVLSWSGLVNDCITLLFIIEIIE